jgi:peroxiredoxin
LEARVKVYVILLTALLATILAMGPGEVMDQTPPHNADDAATRNFRPLPPEPPSASVDFGDRAPDFAFQGEDNRWRRLHELLSQGPVLLVFAADNATLTALEHERDAILKLGALPVAVLDMRNSVAWATARRLGLRYLVIPDSRRVIAAQFNALDAGGERVAPTWFVVGRNGMVRAVKRGPLPRQGYPGRVAAALGLPDPGAGVPIEKRR